MSADRRLVPRYALLVLTTVTSLGLVFSAFPGTSWEAAAEPPPPLPVSPAGELGVEPTGSGPVRPDFVSAGVTARASGQRVEVLSERSERSRTWALPEGLFESEASSGPVRFRDKTAGNDGWRDIDTTLVLQQDGSVQPKAVPATVKLGGTGDTADRLVSITDGGRALALGAGSDRLLPTPLLNGSVATYPEVLPGVDVTVEVRPTGFEQLWVAKTRAGLDALLSEQAGGDQGVTAALAVEDLTAKPQADGGVTLTNADNKTVAKLVPPTVWDAATDRNGDPLSVADAAFQVVDNGSPLPPRTGATGDLELSVVPNQDWLADPGRKFPVTIDPTYLASTAGALFDTTVTQGTTTDLSTSSDLTIGTIYAGSYKTSRAYLGFDSTPLVGKTIVSGSLSLFNNYVFDCSPRSWSAYDSAMPTTATRWTSQPAVSTGYATSTQGKGTGTCAAGNVSIDMKAQLQNWASQTAASRGVMLRATDETDPATTKKFASSETSTPPVLRWTYDRAPATMAVPTIAGTVAYTPTGATTPILYTADVRPSVSGVVSDPDGDTVRGKFYSQSTEAPGGTLMSYCTNGSLVASGTTAACEMDTDIASNTSVWIKARAIDTHALHGAYGKPVELRVAAGIPSAPVISCPSPYTANNWAGTAPTADVDCTISAAGTGYSAPSRISFSVDNNQTFTTIAIPQSTSATTAKTTATLPKASGGHNIRAYALSPTGKQSPTTTYSTGWGAASLLTPAQDAQVTTTDTLAVTAAGPPKGTSALPTAKTQWRMAGADTATAGWVDAPAGSAVTVSEAGGQTRAAGTFNTSSVVDVADGSGQVVNGRVPTLLEVRVCFAYSTGTQCTPASTVLKVPHAFGAGYPTSDAGPGQVALWTGELQVDDSDADLPTPGGALSVSRSHSSFAGPAAVQNQVFGPGWTASFDGDDSGAGGAQLLDGTTQDGTLAVVDADGSALVFLNPTKKRRTTATIPAGTYLPADPETAQAGVKLAVSGTGTSTIAQLTGDDGMVTKFQVTATPTAAAATFRTVEVHDLATTDKTTYAYDNDGRVTAIIAPLPDGVTTCTPGTTTAGCRVLKISYATATTATSTTPGDFAGQVKQVTAQVNTDTDKPLATYKYDTAGRLMEARDVRTNLATTYTWTGTGTSLRLATLTPPGQAPFTFTYATNKLSTVTRPNPVTAGGGTTQLGAFVYNVPVAGTITNLPDMGVEVAKWNQASAPVSAAAVFGPDKPITTAPAAGSPDWLHADLQLTDGQGYTVNTASYGAGDWQLTAADYDNNDNVIRAWDERAIRQLRNGNLAPGAATQLATLTVYNTDITSGGTIVTPAGTLVTDTYGPVHQVAAEGSTAADGTALFRTHTTTTYDQAAPNSGINPTTGQPYRLPTKTVTTAETADGSLDSTLDISLTGYQPVVTGDTLGWDLGQATTTTTDMDQSGTVTAGDITTTTRHDPRGRTIENRQPKSNGNDAGTRVTTYYTAGTSPVSGCGSKPEWAGQVCQVGPAVQPSGQTMPVTKTTGYTWDLQTTTEVGTSGTVISTSTTTYNAQDRPVTSTTTVTGLTGSTPVPAVTTSYNTATGEVTGTSSTAGTTAMTYDNWGRQLTYTNTPTGQTGDSSTTTYDPVGRVISVVDNNGQTAYTYDGTDAAGKAERRGSVTAVKVKATGGTEYTSTGAYDEAGDLTLEKLPGRINRRTTIDVAGDQTQLAYNGQGLNPDTGTLTDDQPWIGWTTTSNAKSQITREWTPDGAAGYNGDLGTTAIASDRTYTYDRADRLTQVQERTGNPTTDTDIVPCTTRTYTFDDNGNRTSQTSRPAASNGDCTTTGGTTQTRAYDTADRPTTGANNTGTYTYDQLGRQTVIPAADAPDTANGNINLAYYDTDNIRTITQNGTTTNYTLDGANRRLTQTKTNGSSTSNTLIRHYADGSDNPTWTVDTTGTTTTTTRYNELINGDLGLTLTTTGTTPAAQLDIATPRGDTATTITLPTGGTSPTGTAATGIDTWTSYSEYGAPLQTVDTTPGGITGIGYGWLGAKQRATLDTGLTLMGARLYNRVSAIFTSADPVIDGGKTRYGYPNDPVNATDLDGNSWVNRAWRGSYRASRWLTNSRWGRRINTACGFAPGWAGTACNGVYTAAYARQGRWGEAGASAAGMFIGGRASKYIYRGFRRAHASHRAYNLSQRRYSIRRSIGGWHSRRNRSYRRSAYAFSQSAGMAIGGYSNYWGSRYGSRYRSYRHF